MGAAPVDGPPNYTRDAARVKTEARRLRVTLGWGCRRGRFAPTLARSSNANARSRPCPPVRAPPPNGDLTTAPIPALVRRLAVPAAIGFFFNTMFNVVDTYFAGRLSTEALAALSLSFPVFFMLVAVGGGFATGTTALIGHALGGGDRRHASLIAAQGVALSVGLGLVVSALGYAAAPPLFRALGAEGAYLDICLQYMRVILLAGVLVFGVHMLNAVLNAQGDTRTFRDALILASVLNVFLDPWLMFGGLGVPPLGIAGLALATVIAQSFSVVLMARRAWRSGLLHRSSGARWRPEGAVMAAIARQGLPAGGSMMTMALGVFVITWFLGSFSREAVAAYGVATRIEQILLLPAIGLNVATLALAAQNGGARRFDRVRQAIRTALGAGAVLTIGGGVVLFLAAGPLMDLFTDDQAVIAVGAHYLRIAAFLEFAYVILFINTSALQGLKRPALALWLGLGRQIVAPVLVFGLATRVWNVGLDGIWWGIFGITWAAALAAVFLARREVAHAERLAHVQHTAGGDQPAGSVHVGSSPA
ncbi:MAG: MATE family efflux transporter [bacterium]|nr:MATE family efflux transporter [bacterium]